MNQMYFAVVEDRMDPLKLGRCRVRVFGLHSEDLNLLPTNDLPWATPICPITSASMSGIGHSPVGPVEGTWVAVMFIDPDQQQPVMLGTVGGIPQTRGNIFLKDDEVLALDNETGKVVSNVVNNEVGTGSGGKLVTGDGKSVTFAGNGGKADILTPPVEKKSTVDIKTAKLSDMLSENDQAKLQNAIRFKESSNDYRNMKNRLGYIGAYQFGASMLTDLRYVKGAGSNSKLKEDQYWAGKNGIKSLEDFLNNKNDQDKAFLDSLSINFRYLKNAGALNEQTTSAVLAGLLAAAHLVGHNGSAKLTKGTVLKDANGVTAFTYYKMGYKEVAGKEPDTMPSTEFQDLSVTTKSTSATTPPTTTSAVQEFVGARTQASIDSRFGFKDPSNRYPTSNLLKEPDTNRLARNQGINETLVGVKKTSRKMFVSVANSASKWNQPIPPYAAQYPFNHVFATESGHVMEFDDTPNAERVQLYHNAGTFLEWDDNGTEVHKIVGDSYTICARNKNISIDGECNITISGNANIYVENNAEIQVDGNLHGVVKNDVKLEVHGNVDTAVGGTMKLNVKDELLINCKEFKLKTHTGAIDLQGAGNLNVDAPEIWFNSGKSTSTGLSAPSYTRASPYPVQLEKLTEIEAATENIMVYEMPEEGDSSEYFKSLVDSGEISEEDMKPENIPIATKVDTEPLKIVTPLEIPEPKSTTSITSAPAAPNTLTPTKTTTSMDLFVLSEDKKITKDTRVSPNFTIANFCGSEGAPNGLTSQDGISIHTLATNCQFIAINVLEPIKKVYPDVRVTSGFREKGRVKNSASKSDHYSAQAVDIVFDTCRGNAEKIYERATKIKNLIPFNKMILEYRKTKSGVQIWIHITCTRSGNSSKIFTMLNDAVYRKSNGENSFVLLDKYD